MPGILPMKVIKVGTSAQSRIAQACDRCRSKKIRCDGVRPTCSQCANVGFECRTSDKLSRRAFPRGYTESLEERVRALETEVRELKDLLDEKDEKIDMLSAMHKGPGPRRLSTTSASPPVHQDTGAASSATSRESTFDNEDTFRVQASPLLLGVENSDAYFMGASSGRTFITALKRKLQQSGKPCTEFNPEAFLHVQGCPPLTPNPPEASLRIPPRLFTDRCVNVYFQEWASLFPALHKPTFLRVYEEFVADPEKVKCNYKIAQLYLVFSLAGLSSSNPDLEQLAACERQWTGALEAVLLENTMSALQCLVLALLYCSLTADYRRLQHYKSIAVGLAYRLGLHQSQKRFSFGALTLETRKKVFWTLYTVDCFSAATLGLPKLLREDDLQVEYPSDTDDEYVTEKGFQPTLPGEHTRLSSALALFRATRILAKVLEKNYPSATTYDLSLQQMNALESELDGWYDALPAHLRLRFAQDKPSTDVTGSRSPLLALAYYFIRTLIYRPAIGSGLGYKAAPALMSIADSSKHIIQISELLEERNLSFSFCLNKGDLLTISALALLYQVVDLKAESKLAQENQRLVNSVVSTVDRLRSPGCVDLRRIAGTLVTVEGASLPSPASSLSSPRRDSTSILPTAEQPRRRKSSGDKKQKQLQPQHVPTLQDKSRRLTMPVLASPDPELELARSRGSFDSVQSDRFARTEDYMCMSQLPTGSQHANPPLLATRPNLDYLSLHTTPDNGSRSQSPPSAKALPPQPQLPLDHQAQVHLANMMSNTQFSSKAVAGVSNNEWEALLGSMDSGLDNVYNAIYGGATVVHGEPPAMLAAAGKASSEWSPDSWDLSSFSLGDFTASEAPQSVLSLSDESLSSGEEVSPPAVGQQQQRLGGGYQKQMQAAGAEHFNMDAIDGYLI
ncbi:C6 transcription factor FacB [Cordyceps fumosorosea ARSEF 2679]|uniref:C6 transcription factor FacB n=1 Tax=Cordyceps fumosorosea (strain ARSEF 2679) TaxID=1081104 RepID=A0A167QJD3_CORFA|nr:C6 transcription factor FacB [Cordyceps fumosorosea ARSEF 2679]OAA57695.1 C6 transcription factor FacB [Cordyceps fumosorosea ARSEF 2679]